MKRFSRTQTLLFTITAAIAALCINMSAAAGIVNYTYDAAGRLTKADFGEGKSIAYAYDPAGNLLKKETRVPGDVNGDGEITLIDALDALNVQAGGDDRVQSGGDVDNDGKIDLPEAEYVLQKAAGLRR